VILEKEFPAVKDNLNNSLLPATQKNIDREKKRG
jgi:hypothetical protein